MPIFIRDLAAIAGVPLAPGQSHSMSLQILPKSKLIFDPKNGLKGKHKGMILGWDDADKERVAAQAKSLGAKMLKKREEKLNDMLRDEKARRAVEQNLPPEVRVSAQQDPVHKPISNFREQLPRQIEDHNPFEVLCALQESKISLLEARVKDLSQKLASANSVIASLQTEAKPVPLWDRRKSRTGAILLLPPA